MIAILKDTTETFTAVLSAAITTTNPTWSLIWKGEGGPVDAVGNFNGTTVQTLLTGPSVGNNREIESLTIHNRDTVAAVVSISKVVSGTDYRRHSCSIPVGGTLTWTKENGIVILNANGTVDSVTVGTAEEDVTASESGNGPVRKTVLTLTDVPVTVGNTTGVSFGGTKIYNFPEGRILVLGSVVEDITFDLTDAGNVTPIVDTMGGDVSFGTTPPDDGTLTNEDVDIIPSTSIDPISGGIAGAALAASAQFDGTGTAKDIYVNVLIDDADVADGAEDVILVSGVLTLHWINLGDY